MSERILLMVLIFVSFVSIVFAEQAHSLTLYSITEYRDYKDSYNYYKGAVAGIGVNTLLLGAEKVMFLVDGKLYAGKLKTKISNAHVSIDNSDVTLELDSRSERVNMHSYSLSINAVSTVFSTTDLEIVAGLSTEYLREKIDGTEGKWKKACNGSLCLSITDVINEIDTDKFFVKAGLGINKQIARDWSAGASFIFSLPVNGHGHGIEGRLGVSYKSLLLAVFINHSDGYVNRYGLQFGYSF